MEEIILSKLVLVPWLLLFRLLSKVIIGEFEKHLSDMKNVEAPYVIMLGDCGNFKDNRDRTFTTFRVLVVLVMGGF